MSCLDGLFVGLPDGFLVLRGDGLSVVGSLFGVLVGSLDWPTVGLYVGFCVQFVDGWLDGFTVGLQFDITYQSSYMSLLETLIIFCYNLVQIYKTICIYINLFLYLNNSIRIKQVTSDITYCYPQK